MTCRVYGILHPVAAAVLLVALFDACVVFHQYAFAPRTDRLRACLTDPPGKPLDPRDWGDPILDSRFGYSGSDARQLFDRLGERGRKLYLDTQLTDDIIFPWLYTPLLAIALGLAWCRVGGWPNQRWALLIPALTLAADHGENFLIAWVLLPAWQAPPAWAATAATVCTCTKIVLILGGVPVVVLVGLVLSAVGYRHPKKPAVGSP